MRDLADLLLRGINTLPIDQRMTLVLSDVRGLRYDEIAEITHSKRGTVKSRLSRARATLREYVQRHREAVMCRWDAGLFAPPLIWGDGKFIDVINTHLSAYATSDGRIPQVQKLPEVWNKAPRSVITGGDGDGAINMDKAIARAARLDRFWIRPESPVRLSSLSKALSLLNPETRARFR